jgi:hypothetical protein
LGTQGLKSSLPLAELLDVEPVGQDWEVREDGSVAVDLGGVDLVEAAQTRKVESRMKLLARNFKLTKNTSNDKEQALNYYASPHFRLCFISGF